MSRGLQASDRDKESLYRECSELKQRLEQTEFDLQDKTVQLDQAQSESEQLKEQIAKRSVSFSYLFYLQKFIQN